MQAARRRGVGIGRGTLCTKRALYAQRNFSASPALWSSLQPQEIQKQSELAQLIHDHTRAFALDKAEIDQATVEAETKEFVDNARKQGVQLSEAQVAALREILQFKVAALQAKKQASSPAEYKKFEEGIKKLEAEAISAPKAPSPKPSADKASGGSIYSVVLTAIEQVEAEDNRLVQRLDELFPTKPIALNVFQSSREALKRTKEYLLRSVAGEEQADTKEQEVVDSPTITAPWLQDAKQTDAARLQEYSASLDIPPESPHYAPLKEAITTVSDTIPTAVSEFNKTVEAIHERKSALVNKPTPSAMPPELLADSARQAYLRQHDEQAEFAAAVKAFLASDSKPADAQKLAFMKEQQARFQKQRESFFSSLPGQPAPPPSTAASDSVLLARFDAAAQ